MILPALPSVSISAKGTRVVLPAPGGASSTSDGAAASEAAISGSRGSMGSMSFMLWLIPAWRRQVHVSKYRREMWERYMDKPLKGIRVIEMAGIGPGPFAGMWLADQGAEV